MQLITEEGYPSLPLRNFAVRVPHQSSNVVDFEKKDRNQYNRKKLFFKISIFIKPYSTANNMSTTFWERTWDVPKTVSNRFWNVLISFWDVLKPFSERPKIDFGTS